MPFKKTALVLALALLTTSFTVVQPVFQENSHRSRAIAQPTAISHDELQAAADDMVAAFRDIGLNLEYATNLLNQGQYQYGLELYQLELDLRGRSLAEQTIHTIERLNMSSEQGQSLEFWELFLQGEFGQFQAESAINAQKIEQIAFALVKLAILSEKLGFLALANQALSSAEQILVQATDGLAIFSFSEFSQGQPDQEDTSNSSLESSWNRSDDLPGSYRSTIFSGEIIEAYVPHFNLLQQIYAAKGRLIEVQQGDSTTAQEYYYQGLLASEVVRTLSVDQSIARQSQNSSDYTSEESIRFARAFSSRLGVEEIREVARRENATIVSYSISSESDNPFLNPPNGIIQNSLDGEAPINTQRSRRLSSPDKLLIWVVQPSGEITLKELSISPDWMNDAANSINLPTGDQCAQDRTSDACRGQSSTAIAQLVRRTRSVMGVAVRGEPEIAVARFLSEDLPGEPTANNPDLAEQLNRQDEALRKLYKLLIEPIAVSLPTSEEARVVFIPQGSLSFVPFAALKDDAGQYLIERHTIQSAPNFRTLLLANLSRQQRPSNNQHVLIVGNPTMPRWEDSNSGLTTQLESLPDAEEEAIVINELFEQNNYEPDLLIGDDATEFQVRNRMKDAQIIHLATHGILDAEAETVDFSTSQYPDPLPASSEFFSESLRTISPAGSVILASSGENEDENGFLTSNEIFDMQLSADLVVLSACNTGRGPLTPGGVVGLPFSLSIAGVPSVVVSLWAVPDDSTAQLMTKFYEYYLANPNDKAQALRLAMLYMMENGYRNSPLDWAAFTLVGTSH